MSDVRKMKKKSEFIALTFCCCFDECASMWLISESDLSQ